MASLRVLAFDHEGRPVQFDTWLDDLQLYLLSNSKDSVSLFDLASGAATAPLATADSATRSQWLTRDAAARLAIRNDLPLAECAHFGQHRTAQALYDAVVARYSSPATAALGRLLLPYLFPELSAFTTVEDLVSHLRASDARYRAAAPAEFLDKNQPPMFITLYFIVTRLPDSLRSIRKHFLALDPTSLTVDLLQHHLLAAETSAVAVGAARGTPRPPFFEGCSSSPLAPSYASSAAAYVSVAEDVGAASASAKRHSSKGKGGKGSGGGSGGGGGGSGSSGRGSSGGGGGGGTGGGSGGSGGGGGGSGGSGGSGGTGTDDAWRAEFGDDAELPRWADLLKSRIATFDLDFDAILSAMYALSVSAEGDCYRCVPPYPDIAAAALGASESGTLPGTAPAQALHTLTLNSGASTCFLRDSTTLAPLSTPIPVRLADPSGGPVVARSSTVLPCPAILSGSLSGLHLPSFSTNLVSTAALQDAMVTTTTPGCQRVSICTCTRTGPHLATCLVRSGSRLLLVSPPVAPDSSVAPPPGSPLPATPSWHALSSSCLWSPQVPASSAALAFLASRGGSAPLLNPRFPRRLLPCRLSAWTCGTQPASLDRVASTIFLLVVDDYTRYTTVFPLRSKDQVVDVLIPWIRKVRLQLRERFGQDLPVLRLHSDRGDSPQQNGIAERRIGLDMEVARTSMIHAAAPHILWPFAVRYTAHQLNLWPCVSLPETLPTLHWTGEVGDASVFRLRGSRAFVRDTSADKLSPRAIPCVFLGFVPDAPGWQFTTPPRAVSSLLRTSHPLLGPVLVQVAVGSGAARGAACGGATSGGAEPRGAKSEGAESGGAEPEGAEAGGAAPGGVETRGGEPGSAEPEGVEPGGTASEGVESGGAEPQGVASSRAARVGGAGVAVGAGVTGGTAATGPGGARTRGAGADGTGGVEGAGAGDPTESRATEAGGSSAGGAGAGGAGVGGTGAGGDGDGGPRLEQVLGIPSSTSLTPPLLSPPPDQSQPSLQQASPLPAPCPYSEQSGGLTERREPASRPVSPVRTACRVPRSRPPPVPGTHAMTLRPSFVPLCVPPPAPPESSLPKVPEPESDRARGASPTVSRLLATALTDPSFESAAASALVAELLDFAAACRLDYATALVAKSVSASPPSIGGECALGTDVLEDRQENFECLAAAIPHFVSMLLAPEGDPDAPDIPTPCSYAEAITSPYSSQWQAAMDVEMASWKSTGTYVDEFPPPGANIVDGMWIFRVNLSLLQLGLHKGGGTSST
ncbi:unnamed protein product [Closterium sp. NIES-53]